MNAPHPEPLEFRATEEPETVGGWQEIDLLREATDELLAERGWSPSPEMRAWIERKLREREGRPLLDRNREQATRQLEDLGAL